MNGESPGNPSGGAAAVPDSRLYPDLIRAGSLAGALRAAAAEGGLDLGEVTPSAESAEARYKTARVAAERAVVEVRLGLGERRFSVTLDDRRRHLVWASGSTGELDVVARSAAAWREGAGLRDLAREFPYLRPKRAALALEDERLTDSQWEALLSDGRHAGHHALLARLRATAGVCEAYPYFSHETLRLTVDFFDRSAREVLIDSHEDGTYTLRGPAEGETAVAGDLDALVRRVVDTGVFRPRTDR
ncbi:hypothetical protein ACL02U_12760 [Streptomyces sp. MS06]|uniref:hypothetical protein n=1 Tax=Streptomyces sp. MS06 TaxID=3385974 RepID=UPI0039A3E533